MWTIKVAQSPDKINEILKDGYEPFAVAQAEKRVGSRPTEYKIYFKKLDSVPTPRKQEVKVVLDSSSLDEFAKELKKIIDEAIERLPINNGGHTQRVDFDEIVMGTDNPDEAITKVEYPARVIDFSENNEMEELDDEEDDSEREIPAGDNYRVVEDAPIITTSRSEKQEGRIKQIRKSSKTNLTISAPDSDGTVTVLVGQMVYKIASDGTTTENENKAHMSSL